MPSKNTLRLTFDEVVNSEQKKKVMSFAKVDEEATDSTIMAFADIMSGLKPEATLSDVSRVVDHDVTEDFNKYVADQTAAAATPPATEPETAPETETPTEGGN